MFSVKTDFFECKFIFNNEISGADAISKNLLEKQKEVCKKISDFLHDLQSMGYKGTYKIPGQN